MNPDHITEWLLALAVAMGAVAVAVGVVRERFARAARVIEDARSDVGDDTLAMLLDGLPGRGNPQPSGVSRNEETGIGEWTDAELAFLRGHRETPDG